MPNFNVLAVRSWNPIAIPRALDPFAISADRHIPGEMSGKAVDALNGIRGNASGLAVGLWVTGEWAVVVIAAVNELTANLSREMKRIQMAS